jgi:hypothetical protein
MAGRPTAITSLRETPAEGKRNWLIYAESGVGKTVLAGTAPKALFLTVEAAGTESAKAFGQEAYQWLRSGGAEDYEWVVIDSLTEMQEICWKDHLEEAKAQNSSRSIYAAAIQDYGIVDNKIKRLVDSFNRLPVNVLYTAQVMNLDMENDEGDDITYRVPLVGRAKNGAPLANLICGKVTMVGLLVVVTKDKERGPFRRLVTEAGPTWIAKDRHDTFGRFVDDPNIAEMAQAVTERQQNPGPRASDVKSRGSKKKPTTEEE